MRSSPSEISITNGKRIGPQSTPSILNADFVPASTPVYNNNSTNSCEIICNSRTLSISPEVIY